MNNSLINIVFNKSIKLFHIIFICVALFPIYNEDGLSLNYSFLLIPFIFPNYKFNLSRNLIFILLIFFSIFTINFIFISINTVHLIGRSIISFLLFLSIFSWAFFKFDKYLLQTVEFSIILFSVCYSIYTIISVIYNIVFLNLIDIFLLKDIVGSNRISFILLSGYFILNSLNFKSKNLFSIIIIIGVFLTFSRAAIVTLILTLILFNLNSKLRLIKYISIFIVIASLFIFAFYEQLYPFYEFFYERLFLRFTDSSYSLTSTTSSEGIRLDTWKAMIEHIFSNFKSIMFGTGYLGPWILDNISVNSSHNQFIDILFRTGIIGISTIFLILINASIYLKKTKNKWLIVLVVLVIYGFFHESFKETQGAFLLSIILMQYFNKPNKILKNNN